MTGLGDRQRSSGIWRNIGEEQFKKKGTRRFRGTRSLTVWGEKKNPAEGKKQGGLGREKKKEGC